MPGTQEVKKSPLTVAGAGRVQGRYPKEVDEKGFALLHERAGACALRGKLFARVRGSSPLSFLDLTTTQDLSGLRPGLGALTCLLDDKGKVMAEMRILPLEDGTVLIDSEEPARAGITGWLARIAPLSACEVVEESRLCTAVRGPDASSELGNDLPIEEHAFVENGGQIIVRVEWGVPGYDVIAQNERDLGVQTIEAETFVAARIASGRPLYGIDVTDSTHINETPLLERAVSFTKGCYPGQESVARVANLGRVRKRLARLTLSSGPIPSGGTVVKAADADVGVVTSAAAVPGGVAALGYIATETTEGTQVRCGEVAGQFQLL
jgi:folate-binding protein YgfZ